MLYRSCRASRPLPPSTPRGCTPINPWYTPVHRMVRSPKDWRLSSWSTQRHCVWGISTAMRGVLPPLRSPGLTQANPCYGTRPPFRKIPPYVFKVEFSVLHAGCCAKINRSTSRSLVRRELFRKAAIRVRAPTAHPFLSHDRDGFQSGLARNYPTPKGWKAVDRGRKTRGIVTSTNPTHRGGKIP